MRRSLATGLSVLFCFLTTSARAENDGPLRLEPKSPWEIDYGEESCALRRTFGTDAASAHLEILQQAPGAYYRVTVTSGTLDLSDSEARVRFEPDNRRQIPAYLAPAHPAEGVAIAFTDSLQKNVLGSSQPFIDWRREDRDQREAAVASLSIDDGFTRNLTLATGEMHAPMEALRDCMNNLYASWGVDLGAHESLTSELQAQNAAQIARQVKSFIPRAFFREDSEMPAVVRVIVGPDGRVHRCRVHFSEWDEPVSQQICDVVTREARFFPARDRTRKPINSHYVIVIER